jgi:hypothetical protein
MEYRLKLPERFEANTTLFVPGMKIGALSMAGWTVKRRAWPPSAGADQMSPCQENITKEPSGDIAGVFARLTGTAARAVVPAIRMNAVVMDKVSFINESLCCWYPYHHCFERNFLALKFTLELQHPRNQTAKS